MQGGMETRAPKSAPPRLLLISDCSCSRIRATRRTSGFTEELNGHKAQHLLFQLRIDLIRDGYNVGN
jgi:hypothetical protein